MNDKVVNISNVKRKTDNEGPLIELGVLYLELYISPDGTEFSFIPSFELEEGLTNDDIKDISNMLKTNFGDAIDQLLSNYNP